MYNFEVFKSAIAPLLKVSDELLRVFMDTAHSKEAGKNELIFCPDKPVQKLIFLEEGFLRAYRILDGTAYTHYFLSENWFATDFKAYLTDQPGELYIETLTTIRYLEFRKDDLEAFFQAQPQFEKLARIMAERAFLKMEERLVEFQTHPLKERYLKLIDSNPKLFQNVPQRFIASYLGVTEQSLSRIKAATK